MVGLDAGDIEVQGQSAAPPLSGLALASVALAGALALAPFVLRIILGLAQVGLSALAVVTLLPAIADPTGSVASRVTETTGIEGRESVQGVIASIDSSPWPVVALVVACLGAVVGVLIVLTAKKWPTPGRRYSAASDAEATPTDPRARSEDEWDALSRGDDPTS